jgi:hypothetical protein
MLSHWTTIQAEVSAQQHKVHPGEGHEAGAGTAGFASVVEPMLSKSAEPQPLKFAVFAALLVSDAPFPSCVFGS